MAFVIPGRAASALYLPLKRGGRPRPSRMFPTWPNHHYRNRQQPISVGGRVGIVARPPPGSLREPPSPLQGEEKRVCLTLILNVDLAVIRTTPLSSRLASCRVSSGLPVLRRREAPAPARSTSAVPTRSDRCRGARLADTSAPRCARRARSSRSPLGRYSPPPARGRTRSFRARSLDRAVGRQAAPIPARAAPARGPLRGRPGNRARPAPMVRDRQSTRLNSRDV